MEVSGKKKPPKPLQLLVNLFQKSSKFQPQKTASNNFLDLELEALHLSRTDNPYLQVLNSQDNLDCIGSPERPQAASPASSSRPLSLTEIHSHLVRSPPPVHWPSRSRSRSFSPTFSSDLRQPQPQQRSLNGGCQSEEHILSKFSLALKSGFSPARGSTPEPEGQSPYSTEEEEMAPNLKKRPPFYFTMNYSHEDVLLSPTTKLPFEYGVMSRSSNSAYASKRSFVFSPTNSHHNQPLVANKSSSCGFAIKSWRQSRTRSKSSGVQPNKSMENLLLNCNQHSVNLNTEYAVMRNERRD